jgi:hypothetical protein
MARGEENEVKTCFEAIKRAGGLQGSRYKPFIVCIKGSDYQNGKTYYD